MSLCFRFEKIEALGSAVLSKTPGASDVKDKMKRLADDKDAIDEMYQKRLKDLQDAYDLQLFNKEADNIDSVTGNHEKLLNQSNLGVSSLITNFNVEKYVFECM